jgi:hypothetical protein
MDDSSGVCGREAAAYLQAVLDGLARRDGTVGEPRAERVSIQQLEDDVRDSVLRADVVDGEDVGMVEGRDGPGFLLESAEAVGVALARRGHDLESDIPSETGITRAVDLAHAPRAQGRADLILAETATGYERHRAMMNSNAGCSMAGLKVYAIASMNVDGTSLLMGSEEFSGMGGGASEAAKDDHSAGQGEGDPDRSVKDHRPFGGPRDSKGVEGVAGDKAADQEGGYGLWSRRTDLNRGPADYESAALPLSYAGIARAMFWSAKKASVAERSGPPRRRTPRLPFVGAPRCPTVSPSWGWRSRRAAAPPDLRKSALFLRCIDALLTSYL